MPVRQDDDAGLFQTLPALDRQAGHDFTGVQGNLRPGQSLHGKTGQGSAIPRILPVPGRLPQPELAGDRNDSPPMDPGVGSAGQDGRGRTGGTDLLRRRHEDTRLKTLQGRPCQEMPLTVRGDPHQGFPVFVHQEGRG